MTEQSGEKEFEATESRLQEARKKGDIPRSNEVTTFLVYAGFWGGLALFGGAAMLTLAGDMAALMGHASENLSNLAVRTTLTSGLWFLMTLIGGPFVCVVLGLIAQRGVVFAPDKIRPKLSRISPIENAKNKFGSNGLFEFLKSAFKLIIFAAALGFYLSLNVASLLGALQATPGQAGLLIVRNLVGLLSVAAIIAAGFAVVDFAWQQAHFRKRMMMTRQDLKDDMKQTEGDPLFKQHRRQKAMSIAMNSMMADAATADVVVVNPTHFAVALKWDRDSLRAPVCVAKGVDEVAARIREIAQTNAVPIKSDPPTARALFATVDVGQEIGRDHYKAVAAAIRFAEAIRKKAYS